VSPSGFWRCHLLHDIASKIPIGTTLSLLKADRLEAYPTFAMVGCAAKPSSPTLRKTLKAHTHLLGPKRSILAGLIKFLAVGCGFNEVSPWANAVDWLFHY
jgi:hypothetical protein